MRAQPRNLEAHRLLGDALLSLDRFPAAAEEFEKLSLLHPDEPKVWDGLGVSYEGLARQNFDLLERIAPDSPYWLVLVAESRAKGDEFKGAFFFYREVLKRMPGMRGVHTALADVYRKTGHSDWAGIEEEKEHGLPPLDCGKGDVAVMKSASNMRPPQIGDPVRAQN